MRDLKQTVLVMMLSLLAVTAGCASTKYSHHAGMKPGTPSNPKAGGELPLPCPPGGPDKPVAVLYFYEGGFVRYSRLCRNRPGDSDKAQPQLPVRKAINIDFLSDGADPCYRWRVGGTYVWRCY